jgi:drug/metabolite transporter (DMT)-like permease
MGFQQRMAGEEAQRMRSAPQAVFPILAAALILGFNPVAMKLIYALPAGVSPFQFIASRTAWCLVMYAVVAFAFRPSIPISHLDWWKFALLGLCYGPGVGGLLPLGVSLTSATHTVLLYALGPPLTAALGALLLHEALPRVKAIAMIVGVAGAVTVALGGSREHASSLIGDLLVTGMVIATAVQTLVLRRLKGNYSPLFIAALYGMIGSIILLTITLPLGGARYIALPLRIGVTGELLFFGEIVIGVSLLAQMFQSLALHTLKAGMVSALVRYGALLTGTISASFLLGENASAAELVGGLLLASSVGLSLVPNSRISWAESKLQPYMHPDFHPLH